LISRFQGRLLAFAEARLSNHAAAEDVVQETFLGFLVALPNYDEKTPLESFLFAIAAHKLTDVLRRNGRRPTLPLIQGSDSQSGSEPVGRDRKASSMARSAERNVIEERVLGDCMRGLIQSWFSRGEFERLQCTELMFVLGWPNKDVAQRLGISEQAVANHKSFVLQKLKSAATVARLRDIDWSRFEAS
jgi:RNA polymerase sigma-70 factor (ECF subfamily)